MSSIVFFLKFRDWASMARLPNVPTVWSNVLTAWVLAGGAISGFSQTAWLVRLIFGGMLLYLGGTLLNDVHDVEFDRQHRPERPIPSGRVSRRWAGGVAIGLLVVGSLLFVPAADGAGLILPLCIVAYTLVHKRLAVCGIVLMGLCRFALGVIVGLQVTHDDRPAGIHLHWALALFIYVCCISWLARGESRIWRRTMVGWMLAALPLVDAVFLLQGREYRSTAVPIICMGLAWVLRRVAAAT